MRPSILFFSPLLLGLTFGPAVARADASSAPERSESNAAADPALDPTVARLLNAKSTLRWNYSGREGRYGHAEALVDAPAEKVASAATEFGKYRELHRKFATARVVGKEAQSTDVYMRYPVQIGPVKIEFWEVMRFAPARMQGDSHIIEGRGIKGDMKQGHTVITVKPISARQSLLQVDVLLVPKVPAPQSLIDEELRDGAFDFVNGLRTRAQGWNGPVLALNGSSG